LINKIEPLCLLLLLSVFIFFLFHRKMEDFVEPGGEDNNNLLTDEQLAEKFRIEEKERLIKTVHYNVGIICEELSKKTNKTFSKPFIKALSDVTVDYAEGMCRDAEAFANHANRKSISVEDVLLLTRNNQGLHDTLVEFAEEKKIAIKGKNKPPKVPKVSKSKSKKRSAEVSELLERSAAGHGHRSRGGNGNNSHQRKKSKKSNKSRSSSSHSSRRSADHGSVQAPSSRDREEEEREDMYNSMNGRNGYNYQDDSNDFQS